MTKDISSNEESIHKLQVLMDTWGDAVFRLAYCRMSNKQDAEDVAQTVFLRYFQNQPQFLSDEHAKAWLLRVTINYCNDLHGSAWFQKRKELVEGELSAQEKVNASRVKEAVRTLPEKQQVVIYLRYSEGYSCEEIAGITNESSSTIRSRLHRAKKALRTMLGTDYE